MIRPEHARPARRDRPACTAARTPSSRGLGIRVAACPRSRARGARRRPSRTRRTCSRARAGRSSRFIAWWLRRQVLDDRQALHDHQRREQPARSDGHRRASDVAAATAAARDRDRTSAIAPTTDHDARITRRRSPSPSRAAGHRALAPAAAARAAIAHAPRHSAAGSRRRSTRGSAPSVSQLRNARLPLRISTIWNAAISDAGDRAAAGAARTRTTARRPRRRG